MKRIDKGTMMIELNPLSKAIAQIIARMKVASMMMQAQRRVERPVVSIDDERGWLDGEVETATDGLLDPDAPCCEAHA